VSQNKLAKSELENIFNLAINDQSSLTDESAYILQLKIRLEAAILYLLDHQIEKLFNILYRIDVSDKDTKAALELGLPQKIAQQLAQKIIDREIKKRESQRKYRGDHDQ
jgi:hypothetical protein